MSNAIGKALKDKIFKKNIEIGLQLGQIDHCRIMYEKYLEWAPANCYAWSKYAELERSLSETDRARAIVELAIAQPALDMPELLWKGALDDCLDILYRENRIVGFKDDNQLDAEVHRKYIYCNWRTVPIDEEQTRTDPELLAEMMDMREAVEEASDSQALKQIESQIQMKLEAWSSSFNEAFMKWDFDNAIAATQRMRYYKRGVEEIVKKS